MPITPKQLEDRHNYFGSSEMASLLGIHSYVGETPAKIVLSKIKRLEGEEVVEDYKQAGNEYEEATLNKGAKQLGVKIRKNQFRRHPKKIHLGAHIDAITIPDGRAMEAKMVGRRNPLLPEWGDEDTPNDIPESVIIQTMVHMACQDTDLCYVPALILGDFHLYHTVRNDELIHIIEDTAEEYWEKYVVPGKIPPDSEPPPYDFVKRLVRQPRERVVITYGEFERVAMAYEQYRNADKAWKEEKSRILAEYPDAEEFVCETDDTRLFTYYASERRYAPGVEKLTEFAETLPEDKASELLGLIKKSTVRRFLPRKSKNGAA